MPEKFIGLRKFIGGYTLLLAGIAFAIINKPIDPVVLEFVKWLIVPGLAILVGGNVFDKFKKP